MTSTRAEHEQRIIDSEFSLLVILPTLLKVGNLFVAVVVVVAESGFLTSSELPNSRKAYFFNEILDWEPLIKSEE